MSDEDAKVALLAARFGRSAGVLVGIGDDAAVLAPDLVWTVDAQIEGTHFRRSWMTFVDVGYRSYMAAASDLAAMGASPIAALSSLVLPPDLDDAALDAIATGQAEAAAIIGAPVVGGNLARGAELSITTTLLGRAARPVVRSGARAGERVYVRGALGLAAAGLRALQRGVHGTDSALSAFRRPRALAGTPLDRATAAIDVSDGLVRDLGRLATASAVRVVLDASALLAHGASELADAATAVGCDPLALALYGGEDYALAVTSAIPLDGFVAIGDVVEGTGVAIVRDATIVDLRGGFDHFV